MNTPLKEILKSNSQNDLKAFIEKLTLLKQSMVGQVYPPVVQKEINLVYARLGEVVAHDKGRHYVSDLLKDYWKNEWSK